MNNYSKIIPLLIPNPWDFSPGKSAREEPASTRNTVQELINKRDKCLLKYSLCVLCPGAAHTVPSGTSESSPRLSARGRSDTGKVPAWLHRLPGCKAWHGSSGT